LPEYLRYALNSGQSVRARRLPVSS
jgi:hypothetical protein